MPQTQVGGGGGGAHLGQNSLSKKHLHINLLEIKAVLLALQFFKTDCKNSQVLIASDNTSVVAYINKHGGMKSAELCALMWRILTWCVSPKQCYTQSKICTGLTQRDSGRPLKEEPDPINTVVPFATNLQSNFKTLEESPCGPVCNQPEQDISSLRLSDSRPSGLGSGCPEHPIGKPDCLHVPSHALLPKVVQKLQWKMCRIILIATGWPTKPWFLGPSGDVSGYSKTTTIHTNSAETTTEQQLPCQLNIPEPPCLASRNSVLWEHGFTAEVADRITFPQRLSTRSIYATKLIVFQWWCREKQVDFRNPSIIRDISNFFWYLMT